jgi:hypothetical protein
LGVGLLVAMAHSLAWAQYGGRFVSATPQSPIQPGEPLTIQVAVLNDSGDVWEAGVDLEFAWLTQVDSPSWCGGCPALWFGAAATVYPDDSAGMTVTLPADALPGTPGNYSVQLATAFNYYDLVYSVMDGSPKTVNFTIAAPAANQPPVIAAISDKAVVETNLLTFTVSVTDTDLPPQTLTFSLEPGAPAGTGINSSNGLFTWTPPAGSGLRTNEVTVRVTDNGEPPLSSTASFRVIVLDPPRLLGLSCPAQSVAKLVWESFPGKTYRVQFKDDVAADSWTNVGEAGVVAADFTTSLTNNAGTTGQRFYQVVIE